MHIQFIRSGMVAMLLFVVSGVAQAQDSVQLRLRVSVSESTCDISISRGPSLNFEQFIPSAFSKNGIVLSDGQTFTLSFPHASCHRAAIALDNQGYLKVVGPSARGAQGASWGDHYTNRAFGIRLTYAQAGVTDRIALTPKNDRVLLRYAPGRLHHGRESSYIPDVVFRPEVHIWDRRRVREGASLAVPLVFSLSYL